MSSLYYFRSFQRPEFIMWSLFFFFFFQYKVSKCTPCIRHRICSSQSNIRTQEYCTTRERTSDLSFSRILASRVRVYPTDWEFILLRIRSSQTFRVSFWFLRWAKRSLRNKSRFRLGLPPHLHPVIPAVSVSLLSVSHPNPPWSAILFQ